MATIPPTLQNLAQQLLGVLNKKIALLPTKYRVILAAVGLDAAISGLTSLASGKFPTLPQIAAIAVIAISLALAGEDLGLVALARAFFVALQQAGVAVGAIQVAQESGKIIADFDLVTSAINALLSGAVDLVSAAFTITNALDRIIAGAVTAIEGYVAGVLAGDFPLPIYGGTGPMACTTTHSSKVQGAGLCCTEVSAGRLVPPPPGTTLPVYNPGDADAGRIPAGRISQVTDAAGHCASCMIVGSTSKKHPGKPVLKFVRGGPTCPTSSTGCCAMAGA